MKVTERTKLGRILRHPPAADVLDVAVPELRASPWLDAIRGFSLLKLAEVMGRDSTARWSVAEIVLEGPSHGNPFTDVALGAVFHNGDRTVEVAGFYDGDRRCGHAHRTVPHRTPRSSLHRSAGRPDHRFAMTSNRRAPFRARGTVQH
jgi:hypothetical protein